MRSISRFVFYISLVCLAILGLGVYVVWSQGIKDIEWRKHFSSAVIFDDYGIPTIQADSWEQAFELQGFVVASERLWQMDLLRRKASGRLSEWFGEKSLEHDKLMLQQDRMAIAERAVELLPADERSACNAYARGVNRFILEYPYRWGVEYFLLMAEPQRWTCRDTIYVFMNLVETLTSQADREFETYLWTRHLSSSWKDLLFPSYHPWNKPLFGQHDSRRVVIPTPPIPISGLSASDMDSVDVVDDFVDGSNSWAYASGDHWFLANDPHLGQTIPGIWYLTRLFISKGEWGVGASIPGIPGIILGRNPHLAWAFTNTGEDVDDYVFEEVNEAEGTYKNYDAQGNIEWKAITVKQSTLVVGNHKNDIKIESQFTERGPLVRMPNGQYASRQWLLLRPELYRLPVTELLTSKNGAEMQKALSHLTMPSQNVTYFTNDGTIGFRVSGTGVVRQSSGLLPQSAKMGAWQGFQPRNMRPHLEKRADSDDPSILATANEQIWVDEVGHHWSADDRKKRIVDLIENRRHLTLADMQKIQLDTQSDFRKLLLSWFAQHVGEHSSTWQKQHKVNWLAWDGNSRTNPQLFRYTSFIENAAYSILMHRIYTNFLSNTMPNPPQYTARLKRTLLLNVMNHPQILKAFGLDDAEFADMILNLLERDFIKLREHQMTNRWAGQHPFVKALPLLGKLFAVHDHVQWGAFDTVNAESPKHGPSLRMVWDMREPQNSVWNIPIGQSGHVGSKFFSNLQSLWVKGAAVAVFPADSQSDQRRHFAFFN